MHSAHLTRRTSPRRRSPKFARTWRSPSSPAFLGDEVLSMTQFEEHMIDILAAEEEDVVAVRNYVEGHGSATLNLVQAEETDPLEKLPGVPQGACAEALRAIVRPEMGRFSMFIYGCILGNLFTMAIYPLHSGSNSGKIQSK